MRYEIADAVADAVPAAHILITKRCTKCAILKDINRFSANKRKPDGRDPHCRECIRARMRNKKARHADERQCRDCGASLAETVTFKRCRRCLDRNDTTQRSRKLRADVIHGYGGDSPACACCREQTPAFLTLDHINNGGRAHRRNKGNQGVYHELRRADYPAGFQILCFNCNIARGLYGSCPHLGASRVRNMNLWPEVGCSGEPTRRCTSCSLDLVHSAFYADRRTRSGLQSRCRTCTRAASLARLKASRFSALAHYSAGAMCCACCGERDAAFLALDHISGEGPRMPGGRSGGNVFFAWLQREGFPPGLQVLCHNCNCAKGKSGVCPHTCA
jgi:hypothetical protein